MPRALAIRHIAFEDLGSFAPVLSKRGFDIDYVEAAGGVREVDGLRPDLLVVLGGPIGAYEDASYPFLKDELRVLEGRLRANQPTLGICLGAQLMARALGVAVYPGPRKEIGWAPLNLTPEGRVSSLRFLDGGRGPVLHWHGDTFDLPAGAVRLASTPLYENQAFSWREGGLALQFHPEVTAGGLKHWFIGHACEIAAAPDLAVADLRAASRDCAPELVGNGQAFLSAWLDDLNL